MTLIDQIADSIRTNYVLADTANEIADQLAAHRDVIDSISEPYQLARKLTKLLREVSNDRHFAVSYHPEPSDAQQLDWGNRVTLKRNNHYFDSVRRLVGNIGYLELRMFPDVADSAEIAIGAMAFLANTNALIFDLRRNHGGHPSMIQLLLSYLFDEPKHINSFYYRPSDTYTQSWTWAHVPGKRMSKVPVYVLTSQVTGSAAEEFAYDLQQMGRGTLVGETTVGAAHPVSPIALNNHFVIAMPTGRPINPISKLDWEGRGVQPDVAVSAEKALETAHLHALETLILQTASADDRAFWQWEMASAQAIYNPPLLSAPEQYVGNYGERRVLLVDGQLVYRSPQGEQQLMPLEDGLFEIADGVRVRFSADKMTFHWRDSPRTLDFHKT